MRFLILTAVVLVGCGSDPSPAEGTWVLTMTPDLREFDCIYWGDIANEPVGTSFDVIATDAGLIVDSGPSTPGVAEIYHITELDDGARVVVDTFEDGVMEGHARLEAVGKTVAGSANVRLYGPDCEQYYTVTGRIRQ